MRIALLAVASAQFAEVGLFGSQFTRPCVALRGQSVADLSLGCLERLVSSVQSAVVRFDWPSQHAFSALQKASKQGLPRWKGQVFQCGQR